MFANSNPKEILRNSFPEKDRRNVFLNIEYYRKLLMAAFPEAANFEKLGCYEQIIIQQLAARNYILKELDLLRSHYKDDKEISCLVNQFYNEYMKGKYW